MGLIRAIKKFPTFIKEVKLELKKVSWSTRVELMTATVIVLIGSVFLTIYIALIDLGLSRLIQIFLK